MTMADRIVVMKDGVIQQTDTPQNLYKHPCNMFVAGFIGTPGINFLKGTVGKKDGRLILKFGKYEIPFPTRMQKGELGEYIGKEVVLGIRPEDIHIEDIFVDNSSDTVFEAEVELIKEWNKSNPEYKIFISPITFE